MPITFKADESVPSGVKRMIGQHTDKALAALRRGPSRAEGVHDARKRFKRVRALLRLVRAELGSRAYHRANETFRDAGRPLSEVRDAEILVEALEGLAERFAAEVPLTDFVPLRRAMEGRKREIWQRVLDEQNAPAQVVSSIKGVRKTVRRWGFPHKGWLALADGLLRAYDRAAASFAAAATPTDESLHECRKQAKYLWSQLEVLRPVRPKRLGPLADLAHQLGDLLGDDHDLAVLGQTLTADKERFAGVAIEQLRPLIERRRAELQKDAARVGRQLYADPPVLFVARLRRDWRRWRKGAAAAR
jgi:CHAD domain-containing protein